MKNKNSVINRFESPYPLICELKVKEFNGNGTLVNERDSTVADLCAAAEKNACVVITAEEYKALVSYRDEYLAAKEKDIDKIYLEPDEYKALVSFRDAFFAERNASVVVEVKEKNLW